MARPTSDRSSGVPIRRKPKVMRPSETSPLPTICHVTHRIGILVSLPFDKLSKLSLHKELDEIGKTRASKTKEPA